MTIITKILGLAGMGSTIANAALLRRFIQGISVVIALTAISSTLAGVLIVAAFYGIFLGLMHYGMDRQAAVITVSSLSVIVTIWLGTLAMLRWRELRDMPRSIFPETPIVGQATRLAGAFVDGLLERTRHS